MAAYIVMLALSLLVFGATQGRSVKDDKLMSYINELKEQVHDMDKRLLKTQFQVQQLEHTVEILNKTAGYRNQTSNFSDCVQQPSQRIKDMVKAFEKNMDWSQLRRGLKGASGVSSKINGQLDDVWFGENAPLYQIGSKGYTELASLLICSGLSGTTADRNGGNMLHGASNSGQVQLVKLLLRHGADLNKTYDGKTSLIYAAEKGYLEVVKALVEAGAKTDIKDKFGRTALWRAEWNDKTSVANYLKQFPH